MPLKLHVKLNGNVTITKVGVDHFGPQVLQSWTGRVPARVQVAAWVYRWLKAREHVTNKMPVTQSLDLSCMHANCEPSMQAGPGAVLRMAR